MGKTSEHSVARSFKKTERATTSIQSLPRELISEVIARVGASSFKDVLSVKMSCKIFHEVAEDRHIYRHMSLDDFPFVAWKPPSENQQALLTKCKESHNPEVMYKQVMVDYFTGKRLDSGLKCLQKAEDLKHIGAMYVTCIVLLFGHDDELKEKCVRMLAGMKKCESTRRELKIHRDKLIKMLKLIWVKNSFIRDCPVCCTREDKHKRRTGWPQSPDEEEDTNCEACSVDNKISFISSMFSQQ